MASSIRNWLTLGAVGLTLVGFACSSSDDDDSASGGKPGSGGSAGAAGHGVGGNTPRGGTMGYCPPASAGASGEAGTAGANAGTGPSEPSSAANEDCSGDGLPWLHVEGNAVKDPSGNTVVLRGVALIDLGVTEASEGGVDAMLDRVTNPDDPQGDSPAWATKVVRLVVTPADSGSDSPTPYVPGTEYYEHVLRPAVDHARARGLYAIIDWHYTDTTSLHTDTTNEFWADIAPRFARDSNVLFELYNEPVNGGDWAGTRVDMQGFYDTVHAAAPYNLVLVGTPNWCQIVAAPLEAPIDGPNVAYVAHMPPANWQYRFLQQQIADAAAVAPVFVTEWGFQEQSDDAEFQGTISSYGAPLREFIDAHGVSWTASSASSTGTPPMFDSDYNLLVGEGEMGGFVKDWLYEKRDADLPQP
jgi:endoglucanase